MTTVHKRVMIASGAAGAGIGIGLGGMALGAGGGMSQFVGFLKGAGVLSLVLGLIFIAVKTGILRLVMLEPGEVALILRRGKIVRDKRTGLPKVLYPGKSVLHVSLLRHVAVISTRERVTELGSHPFTVEKKTWETRFSLVWGLDETPEALELALTKVHDTNKFDAKFGGLTDMLQEMAIASLVELTNTAQLDDRTEVPQLDTRNRVYCERLESDFSRYGSRFCRIQHAPIFRFANQHEEDGHRAIAASNLAIAQAIKNRD